MQLTSSRKAAEFLRGEMNSECEEFWILGLAPNKNVIAAKCLFRGTVDSCLVHPRDIIRFACMSNSSGVIVGHNHPSGDPEPSKQDIRFTKKLRRIGALIEIPIIDHIIVTADHFTSFREHNWFGR